MKKVLFAFVAAAALVCSCTKDLENRVGALEDKVAALEQKVNANVNSIEQLLSASARAVTISSVVKDKADDSYTITFSDGTVATISNGKDGENGENGVTPVLGVQEIDGVSYWTVNGELLKYNGENVPVKGADGVNGKDGLTPQFKIENDIWKVSFDGETWNDVPVSGTVAPTLTMEETDAAYKFTLGEQTISILKNLVIKVENYKVAIEPGGTYNFSYTLTGADETTYVIVESKNFEAEIDTAAKTVTITAPKSIENGYILVKAVRNSDSQYSAQYIVVKKNEYGSFGGVIISDSDPYTEW